MNTVLWAWKGDQTSSAAALQRFATVNCPLLIVLLSHTALPSSHFITLLPPLAVFLLFYPSVIFPFSRFSFSRCFKLIFSLDFFSLFCSFPCLFFSCCFYSFLLVHPFSSMFMSVEQTLSSASRSLLAIGNNCVKNFGM